MNEESSLLYDAAQLIESLGSTVCPACGGPKNRGHTFCSRDYFTLTKQGRTALYQRVGDGYEEAFSAALKKLGVDRPFWPGDDAAEEAA